MEFGELRVEGFRSEELLLRQESPSHRRNPVPRKPQLKDFRRWQRSFQIPLPMSHSLGRARFFPENRKASRSRQCRVPLYPKNPAPHALRHPQRAAKSSTRNREVLRTPSLPGKGNAIARRSPETPPPAPSSFRFRRPSF